MGTIERFNGPEIDASTLPKSSGPSQEDIRALGMYVDTGCIPMEYLERVAGTVGDSVVVKPRSTEPGTPAPSVPQLPSP